MLTKPEKLEKEERLCFHNIFSEGYNNGCELWQAYHDQEMTKKDAQLETMKQREASLMQMVEDRDKCIEEMKAEKISALSDLDKKWRLRFANCGIISVNP